MDKSTIHNKMITLDLETKVKFNMDIHGFHKDQVVKIKSVPYEKQILIRRRFSDNDGCVEVVNDAPKQTAKPVKETQSKSQNTKPHHGNTGSKTIQKEDS